MPRSSLVRPAPRVGRRGTLFSVLASSAVGVGVPCLPAGEHFWPAAGIVLGLLLVRRAGTIAVGSAFVLARVAGGLIGGGSLSISLLDCLSETLALAVACLVLRPLGRAPDLLGPGALGSASRAIVLGPLVGALVQDAARRDAGAAAVWFIVHALGFAILTPMVVDLLRGRVAVVLRRVGRDRLLSIVFLAVTALVMIVFAQTRNPLLFLLSLPWSGSCGGSGRPPPRRC